MEETVVEVDVVAVLRGLVPDEPGLSATVTRRTDHGAFLKIWFDGEPDRWVVVNHSGAWFDLVLGEPVQPRELSTFVIDEDATKDETVEYLTDFTRVALHILRSRPQRELTGTGAVKIQVEVDGDQWTLLEQRGCGRSLAGAIGYGFRRLLGRA